MEKSQEKLEMARNYIHPLDLLAFYMIAGGCVALYWIYRNARTKMTTKEWICRTLIVCIAWPKIIANWSDYSE